MYEKSVSLKLLTSFSTLINNMFLKNASQDIYDTIGNFDSD